MEHALRLARKGIGLASPNPTVGCVIVKDGAVVGEGFHQYDWRDHAEIVALKQAGDNSRGATLYVTLEPCNSTGRTGPCSEALVAAGVSRVVAAMEDPNPKTHGGGFAYIREAGIEVETGVLEAEAQTLNEAFSHWVTTKRPFVTLKSALTLDGQLALPQKRGKKSHEWITSEKSRAEVHRMRHASDALLTGIGTILADDPMLTDRSGLPRRRPLLRVVLDAKLRIPLNSRIVTTSDGDLLVVTAAPSRSAKARKLQERGVELISIAASRGHINVSATLKELAQRDILSVLLEAGPQLNASALAGGAVQKMMLFYAPKLAGSSGVTLIDPALTLRSRMHVATIRRFGPDLAVEILFKQ